MTKDEIKELGALYALGALDSETASEVEAYLRSASDAERRELEELRETASLLPLALPAASVPPQLKERLMARVQQQAQANQSANIKPTSSTVMPFIAPTRITSPPTRWLQIAATFILAVLSSLLFWQNSRLTRQLDDLTQQVAQQAEQLAAQKQELQSFTSSTTRIITLAGTAAPQASAKLVWDTTRREWIIYFDNLPSAPADKDYQLWYITRDSNKISAQVFRPDLQGRFELRLSLPPDIVPRLAATAVTLEPKGGSTQPTGPIFLQGVI